MDFRGTCSVRNIVFILLSTGSLQGTHFYKEDWIVITYHWENRLGMNTGSIKIKMV